MTCYVLSFIEVGTRRDITRHPEPWSMQQVAGNATIEDCGYLNGCGYLHDRQKCREVGTFCSHRSWCDPPMCGFCTTQCKLNCMVPVLISVRYQDQPLFVGEDGRLGTQRFLPETIRRIISP